MKFDFDVGYLGRKCRILAFLAAIAVVAIHSDCTMVHAAPMIGRQMAQIKAPRRALVVVDADQMHWA